jgi:hypothetical protein
MAANANLKRQTLVVLSILLLLAVTWQAAPTAEARLSSCGGDPKFQLSNNKNLTVTETIYTDRTNVKSVTYSVHLPAGVTVNRVIKSDTGLAPQEVVRLYSDNPANTYTVDLVVQVSTAAVPVNADLKVGGTKATGSGTTGQHLAMTVYAK